MAKNFLTDFIYDMQITGTNNIQFTSRNSTIRFADDIARKVNKCFPRKSSTNFSDMKNAKKFKQLILKMGDEIEDMREYKGELFDEAKSQVKQMRAFIIPVKISKYGNCGESAQLAAIVAKVNDINNAYIAELYTKRGRDMNHMVLYVNDTKPYVIDPWLGIADYVSNIIQKYKSEFSQHFIFTKKGKVEFRKVEDDYYSECLEKEISRRQKNKLLKIVPDMLIKKYL